MTRSLVVLGIILTVALGCVLVIGGLGAAFMLRAPTSVAASTPADPSGVFPTPPSGGGGRVGEPAPDFSLAGLDQQTVELRQLRGKVVLLNFWATWCGPCSAEMPNIEQVYTSGMQKDVAIIAVNQGEFADQVRGYADLYHLHFPILLDSHNQVASLYHVQALPTTVFLDRNGIVREVHIGGPMSQDFIQAHLKSLLQ